MTPDGTPMDELPPPDPKPPRGRWTVDGCDWARWELLDPRLLAALLAVLRPCAQPSGPEALPMSLRRVSAL